MRYLRWYRTPVPDATDSTPGEDPGADAPQKLVSLALALNVAVLVAAGLIYFASRSQLVLAQGADSLLDVAAGVVLAVSISVGRQPKDEDHPFGHDRAEPIGAMIAAVLAGVLAFEVLRSGVAALIAGERAELDLWVAVLLASKLVGKVGLLAALGRTERGSALDAARVDARNDVAACASSLGGYAMVQAGWGWADAALALPVGLYIGYSGFLLARDNLRFLMGESPPREVLEELRRRAGEVVGVLDVPHLRAQHLGTALHVHVSILVEGGQSATQGHDISVAVQRRLEEHEAVSEAFVHVDTRDGVEHE